MKNLLTLVAHHTVDMSQALDGTGELVLSFVSCYSCGLAFAVKHHSSHTTKYLVDDECKYCANGCIDESPMSKKYVCILKKDDCPVTEGDLECATCDYYCITGTPVICCACHLVASNVTDGKHYCDFCEPTKKREFAKALANETLGTSSEYDY